MVNLKFSKNIHLKSENFKNPQCNIFEGHWEKNSGQFENFWLRFLGGVEF